MVFMFLIPSVSIVWTNWACKSRITRHRRRLKAMANAMIFQWFVFSNLFELAWYFRMTLFHTLVRPLKDFQIIAIQSEHTMASMAAEKWYIIYVMSHSNLTDHKWAWAQLTDHKSYSVPEGISSQSFDSSRNPCSHYDVTSKNHASTKFAPMTSQYPRR